jgi:hypothetical protein
MIGKIGLVFGALFVAPCSSSLTAEEKSDSEKLRACMNSLRQSSDRKAIEMNIESRDSDHYSHANSKSDSELLRICRGILAGINPDYRNYQTPGDIPKDLTAKYSIFTLWPPLISYCMPHLPEDQQKAVFAKLREVEIGEDHHRLSKVVKEYCSKLISVDPILWHDYILHPVEGYKDE